MADRIRAESTILGSAEPLSDEERAELGDEQRKERRERALEFLMMEALFDKDFGRVLCEKVGAFCRADKELATVLKEAVKGGGAGRSTKWHLGSYEMLLLTYAYAVSEETKGDHDGTLAFLVEYHKRMTGNILSERVIDNKISTGIKVLGEVGQLDRILGVADWVRDAIQKRIVRGKTSKKRKPRTPVPKARSSKCRK